jgi:hypothetical protein
MAGGNHFGQVLTARMRMSHPVLGVNQAYVILRQVNNTASRLPRNQDPAKLMTLQEIIRLLDEKEARLKNPLML